MGFKLEINKETNKEREVTPQVSKGNMKGLCRKNISTCCTKKEIYSTH